MRHQVRKKRLGRHSSHRIAMFRNMVTSLIEAGRLTTTLTKAKELRSLADKMVTLAKTGTLHARRQAAQVVRTNDAVKKLFAEIGPSFKDRNGGYTRVLKLGNRHGDGAPMAIIEYLGFAPQGIAKGDPDGKAGLAKKGAKKKEASQTEAKPKAEKKKPAKKKAESSEKKTKPTKAKASQSKNEE